MLLEVAEISDTGKMSSKILVMIGRFCISGTAVSTKRVIVLLVVEKFESSAWVIIIVVVPTPVIPANLFFKILTVVFLESFMSDVDLSHPIQISVSWPIDPDPLSCPKEVLSPSV